jgi:DNA-binding LacI/PurR family transcriptional regulator
VVVSLKDIAKRSRVSFQTVSAVLNPASGNTRVGEKTRERVLRAVKDLNYRKNTAGRGLATGRTFTLGFITPTLRYPTNAELAECLQQIAGEINHGLLVTSLDNHDEKTVVQMRLLSEQCVDGIILCPTMSNKDVSCIEILRQYDIPFVVSGDVPNYDVTFASFDNYNGSYQVTDHVLKQGYSRPALVTGWASLAATPYIVQGFQKKLQEAGIEKERCPIIHQEQFDAESIQKTIARLVDGPEKADCLITMDIVVAMQAFLYLKGRGITPGRDFGLAVVDDTTWFSDGCLSITGLRYPIMQISQTMVEMLLRRIENPEAPRETQYFKGQVMERNSTKRGPVE